MQGTAFVYSSHDRSEYIHDHFIVQRALRGRENQRVLFLPMSEHALHAQEFSWGRFEWYFRFYERYGLEAWPFYFRDGLRHEDVQRLWSALWSSEVVLLGGGGPGTGMQRYRWLGATFDGEPGKFGRILHERRERGLLTVGFSAGADQLCERMFRDFRRPGPGNEGFGMVRDAMVTLHHDSSWNWELSQAAGRYPRYRLFGLPNDSGLNSDWGFLPSGNVWQVIEFVIDESWSEPSDAHHVKTRHGQKIDHFYPDGRHWAFSGGDRLVRVTSQDGQYDDAWFTSGGQLLHYWTQSPAGYGSIDEILRSH